MTAVLTGRGAPAAGRSTMAQPLTAPGQTLGRRDAADPWPPSDWFRKPAQDTTAPGQAAPVQPDEVAGDWAADPGATRAPMAWTSPARTAPSAQTAPWAGTTLGARVALWIWATWPWLVLWPWALAWVAFQTGMAGQSWHFFAQGGRLLFASTPGGGLQLYAAHPELQIGPLALAVSGVLRAIGPGNGEATAIAVMSLTGPLVLAAVWRLVPARERQRRTRLVFAGLLFLPVWTELTTHFAHLDDLMALGFSVAALHAVARRHPVWAGLALAAAADSKPWAAAFVVLVLALPRRQWPAALAAFTGGIAVVWLPFLLADPRTVAAVSHFTIPNDRSSALRVLGVMDPRTPSWDRSAQLLLGMAGGAVAVRRGRWPAVLLVAVAARILLDPGVYAYYTSGAVLGTVVVDLVVTRWRLPWATAAAALLLYAARFTHKLIPFNLHELGELRLLFAIGVPVIVLGIPGWWMARRPGRHARVALAEGLLATDQPAFADADPASGLPPGADPPLDSVVWAGPAQSTARSAARPTSGRGELHVGQRGPRPGMLSQ